MERSEAIASELLGVEPAWPLRRRLDAKHGFSTERLPLFDRLMRKERFALFQAYSFEVDRLSGLVDSHIEHTVTYAAEFRVKHDSEIPSAVLEAQKNPMPQFTLRNIGRMEKYVDTEEPLPLQRTAGVSGRTEALLDEVRNARLPKVEMAQVWSVSFNTQVRDSLRRLLLEDPWENRFGAEVRIDHAGPMFKYIVDGTHPDDMPTEQWGPETIPVPERWVEPTPGVQREERAMTMRDMVERLKSGSGG